MTTFKIYVADLAEYNNGNLKGQWFDMFDYGSIEDLLADIAIMLDGNEEMAIHDYDCDFDCSSLGEYPNLESLFKIKEFLEEDEEKTKAFIEHFGIDELENLSDFDNVILYSDCENEFDLGFYLIDELGYLEVPENLQQYFDYKAYGRDFSINANGGFTSYGFVEWF